MNKTILAIGAALMFSAYAQAQVIEVEQLGDEELTCQELYTEVKSMDKIIAAGTPTAILVPSDSNAVAAAQAANEAATTNAVNAAAQIAAQSGNYSSAANIGAFGSIFGRLAAAAAANAANAKPAAAAVSPVVDTSSAQKRKAHMTSLFKAQKCKVKGLK